MHDDVAELAGGFVTADRTADQDVRSAAGRIFHARVRVAYSVLRHRQDAEDIAQEAFVRAYRRFNQLRDRDRFRAWLVRMTWRLALDRPHRRSRRLLRRSSIRTSARTSTAMRRRSTMAGICS
jgi:RNA polymerase sigma factor (sigma-70 family)